MNGTTDGSQFYNYDEPCKDYSTTRIPVGSGLMLDKIADLLSSTSDARVLDAGAGTGNYALALAPKVKEVVCFEHNGGMVNVLKQRAQEQGVANVTPIQGSLFDKLPFEDDSFDFVMCNQVFHHLDGPENVSKDGFPRCQFVASELIRVVRPGGHICLNYSSPDQHSKGYWYRHLTPIGAHKYGLRCPDDEQMKSLFSRPGCDVSATVILDALQGPAYFNPDCVLDPVFRNGDSLWSHVPPSELESCLATVQKIVEGEAAKTFVETHDKWRQEHGQSTMLWVRKTGK